MHISVVPPAIPECLKDEMPNLLLMNVILVVLLLNTFKVLCRVCIALAFVPSHPRVSAQWPRQPDTSRAAFRIFPDFSGSDQSVGSNALGNPPVQRRNQIMVCIVRNFFTHSRDIVTEIPWARPPKAMRHARHHEQSIESSNIARSGRPRIRIASKKILDLFVEVD